MPLRRYGVLAGRATDFRPEVRGPTPHFQLRIDAAGTPFRVSVNVRSGASDVGAADLLHLFDDDFRHPITAGLLDLADGFTLLPSRLGGLALDYVRGGLFDPSRLRRLPANRPGPANDLTDGLVALARRAIGDDRIHVYAFGDRWGPEPGQPDDVFGFEPGNGIHDLHMNQGNVDRHVEDNGPWQDGALLVHFGADDRWLALFLAFQTQIWTTDDRTGAALRPLAEGQPLRAGGNPARRRPRRGDPA